MSYGKKMTPYIIAQGQRIIQLSVNIIFRDTYLFMGVELSQLSSTLRLSQTFKKEIFSTF